MQEKPTITAKEIIPEETEEELENELALIGKRKHVKNIVSKIKQLL